jgi:hypothetical protein
MASMDSCTKDQPAEKKSTKEATIPGILVAVFARSPRRMMTMEMRKVVMEMVDDDGFRVEGKEYADG